MEKIIKLLNSLNIKPKNIDLYIEAFTHPSYTNENVGSNYQRLEFLGDEVSKMIISEYLFNKYPNVNEGELTKTRSYLDRGTTQIYLAKKYHFDSLVRYSKGEALNTANHDKSLEDVFEAFIGAVYIENGYKFTTDLLLSLYGNILDNALEKASEINIDPKSKLQELLKSSTVKYVITKQRNISLEEDYFIVEARSEGIILGTGKGKNHKEAEKNAALDALSTYNQIKE